MMGDQRPPDPTPEGETAIKPYGLADATALFSQQTSIMNGLWAVYVAATFAIAGFGASISTMPWQTALAVTIGFWVFVIGHLSLLRQTLRILLVLRDDLRDILAHDPTLRFHRTLEMVTKTNNPVWVSTAAHLIIDFCATGALWSRL